MLSKLRFKRSDQYQIAIVARYLSEMYASFLDGRAHSHGYLRIGSEQGIPEWDDIVAERSNGSHVYHQIKRNAKDFSNGPVTRNYKRTAKRTLQDLSTLDKVFESLRVFSLQEKHEADNFVLEVLSLDVQVKKGLTLRRVIDLVKEVNMLGIQLQALEHALPSDYSDIWNWLRSWCGYESADQVLKVFQKLEIREAGSEETIEKNATYQLESWLTDPKRRYADIRHFVTDHESHLSALNSRHIHEELAHQIRPGKRLWVQYQKNETSSSWSIDGVISTSIGQIEPASIVVGRTWAIDGATNLLIYGKPERRITSRPLLSALARLVAHLPASTTAILSHRESWSESIQSATRRTLGDGQLCIVPEAWDNLPAPQTTASPRIFSEIGERTDEGRALHQAMDLLTWSLLNSEVNKRIQDIENIAIQEMINGRWTRWREELEAENTIGATLREILTAKIEQNHICPEIRVGRTTIRILAEAIILRAAVDTATENLGSWGVLSNGLPVRTLALKSWSGTDDMGPYKIDEFPEDLLAAEHISGVLILSGCSQSESELRSSSIWDDDEQRNNMSNSDGPLIFTCDRRWRQFLLQPLRFEGFIEKTFKRRLDAWVSTREAATTAHDSGGTNNVG